MGFSTGEGAEHVHLGLPAISQQLNTHPTQGLSCQPALSFSYYDGAAGTPKLIRQGPTGGD